jgi:hypothetical protein
MLGSWLGRQRWRNTTRRQEIGRTLNILTDFPDYMAFIHIGWCACNPCPSLSLNKSPSKPNSKQPNSYRHLTIVSPWHPFHAMYTEGPTWPRHRDSKRMLVHLQCPEGQNKWKRIDNKETNPLSSQYTSQTERRTPRWSTSNTTLEIRV